MQLLTMIRLPPTEQCLTNGTYVYILMEFTSTKSETENYCETVTVI